MVKPLSSPRQVSKSITLAAYTLLIVLAGVGCYFLIVRPATSFFRAKSWRETPCTIVSSSVQENQGDDQPTYRVNVVFRYSVNGHAYESNRYELVPVSTSFYQQKAEIVQGLRPGVSATCFVDPEAPSQSVLRRDFPAIIYFGLIPIVFVVGGLIGIAITLRKPPLTPALGSSRNPLGNTHPTSAQSPLPMGATVLTPKSTPTKRLIFAVCFTLFWDAVVSIFVWHAYHSWKAGHVEWLLTLFLIPFVLVGIGGIVSIPYLALSFANPKPAITVNPGAVVLGGEIAVSWRFEGKASRIQRLRIFLQGCEQAVYTRGTDTTTDRSVFASIDLLDTQQSIEIESGTRRLSVPADAMHSFRSRHNSVIWSICVKGQIPHWPDVNDEFEITVLPKPSLRKTR